MKTFILPKMAEKCSGINLGKENNFDKKEVILELLTCMITPNELSPPLAD